MADSSRVNVHGMPLSLLLGFWGYIHCPLGDKVNASLVVIIFAFCLSENLVTGIKSEGQRKKEQKMSTREPEDRIREELSLVL